MSNVAAGLEAAALPTASAVVAAARTLLANLGTVPEQVPEKVGPAFGIFVNSLLLQAPSLIASEFSVAVADADSALAGVQAKIAAMEAASTAAASATSSAA